MELSTRTKQIARDRAFSPLYSRLQEALLYTFQHLDPNLTTLREMRKSSSWTDTDNDGGYLIFRLVRSWSLPSKSRQTQNLGHYNFEKSPLYYIVTARRFFDRIWTLIQALLMTILTGVTFGILVLSALGFRALSDRTLKYTALGKALSSDSGSDDPLLAPYNLSLAVEGNFRPSSTASNTPTTAEEILSLVSANPAALSARSLDVQYSMMRSLTWSIRREELPPLGHNLAFLSPFEFLLLRLHSTDTGNQALSGLVTTLVTKYPEHCHYSLSSYWSLSRIENCDIAETLREQGIAPMSPMSPMSRLMLRCTDFLSAQASNLSSWYTHSAYLIEDWLTCATGNDASVTNIIDGSVSYGGKHPDAILYSNSTTSANATPTAYAAGSSISKRPLNIEVQHLH